MDIHSIPDFLNVMRVKVKQDLTAGKTTWNDLNLHNDANVNIVCDQSENQCRSAVSFVLVYYHNRISNFQFPVAWIPLANNLFGLGRHVMKYAAQFRHLAYDR